MISYPDNIPPELLPELHNQPRLLCMIQSDEGFSSRLYKDTEGLNTIGIGFCLDRRLMPREVALFWLDLIIDELIDDLSRTNNYETYLALNDPRKFALINMCYQMGVAGVCQFRMMWGSLAEGDYESAADHAIDSKWYRQTTERATRIATVIRSGTLQPYSM